MGRGGKATRETIGESEGGGRQHDPHHQLKVGTKKKCIWKHFISFLFFLLQFVFFSNFGFHSRAIEDAGGKLPMRVADKV